MIALIAIASISSSLPAIAIESVDEKALQESLDQLIASYFDGDFPRLASLLHPSAQQLFRNELSAQWDKLQRVYDFKQISVVSGLPAHPKDLGFSDAQFFVVACEQAKARHPEIVPDPKLLPFNIRGAVFHGDDNVDITLSYAKHIVTERTDYERVTPLVAVFQRNSAGWQALSCPLARAIGATWERDLANSNCAR